MFFESKVLDRKTLALLERLDELLGSYKNKFPAQDMIFVMRSLTYFEEAENKPEPRSLKGGSWPDVKNIVMEAVAKRAADS